MEIKRGATRTVLIFSDFVIKIPRLRNNTLDFSAYPLFAGLYQGLLCNLQERYWNRFGYLQLCPVLFSDWFGFVVIMPRCKILTENLDPAEFEAFIRIDRNDATLGTVPAENVAENFGLLNGRLVIIDYGS